MEGLLMFIICSSLLLFRSSAVELCNYTITYSDFSGPPIPCALQNVAITLSNLNGNSVRVTGLKDDFKCGASPRTVQAPCDYCTAIVDTGPSRYGQVEVSSEGGNKELYVFSPSSSKGFTKCPGFRIASGARLLSRQQFFLIPTTCVYSSVGRTVECPGCNPSGTCMYEFKVDAQSSLCISSYPIEILIYNDFDNNVRRGTGVSAAFEGTRSQFEGGVSFVGRCVDFCALGIQVSDTSCSYGVNQVSVSGYNITRTFQVNKTLKPVTDIYGRNYDSVYVSQCNRHTPYAVRIDNYSDYDYLEIYIPRACNIDGSVTPDIITCPC